MLMLKTALPNPEMSKSDPECCTELFTVYANVETALPQCFPLALPNPEMSKPDPEYCTEHFAVYAHVGTAMACLLTGICKSCNTSAESEAWYIVSQQPRKWEAYTRINCD